MLFIEIEMGMQHIGLSYICNCFDLFVADFMVLDKFCACQHNDGTSSKLSALSLLTRIYSC